MQSREKKREQFVGDAQKKSKAVPVMVAALVALAAVAVFLVVRSSSDRPEATTVTSSHTTAGEKPAASQPAAGNNQPSVESNSAAVKIPLADLSNQAKFFDYPTADGRKVRFFALKSSDGTYRAAIDACDVCFHAKRGYRQEGDNMICNNCGLPFEIAKIGSVVGGCNPVGLQRAVEGDQLVIKASELQNGARYF